VGERFDPRAFIAAERASAGTVETVEAHPETIDAFAQPSERADFRRFQADREANYRTIEGIEGGGASNRPWATGIATLQRLPRPSWLAGRKWERLVYICTRLDHRWGDAAVAHGWTEADLFGCHPRPSARHGIWMNGLAATMFSLAVPIKVISVAADAITILPVIEPALNVPKPPASAPMSFRRHIGDRPGQSLIWHAYGHETGP
jgi:hypothetical protein